MSSTSGPRPSYYYFWQPDPGEFFFEKKAEKMGADLQVKMMKVMAGSATPEEKMKEGTRLSEEF